MCLWVSFLTCCFYYVKKIQPLIRILKTIGLENQLYGTPKIKNCNYMILK
jgi:hypothetical protein